MIVRTLQIGWAAAGLIAATAADRFRRHGSTSRLPFRLRITLERLGPTFIKLGQALSQRRDLLPAAWTLELGRLQEAVAPFPGEEARRMVEAALGEPVGACFESFDLAPLAAASVAQVHRARLRDGRDVVVKVLRPGVRARIDEDMRILLALARIAAALVPAVRARRSTALVRELWRNLRNETDLRVEARNVRRFVRAFAGSKTIFIPDVIEEASSAQVLVQVMSHGRRLGPPESEVEADRLARAFIDFYMEQFFVVGLFHADPHPGNIFVLEDGRLCFHDFGAVGWLDSHSRQALMSFVQAFIHQDARWLTDAAIDLGLLSGSIDRGAIAQGVEALLVELAGAPLEEWSIAGVILAITRLGGGGALLLPPHLSAMLRTVFTAEGALRLLDPHLNVVQALAASGGQLAGKTASVLTVDQAGLARLEWEAGIAARALPALAARLLQRLRESEGFAVPIRLTRLPQSVHRAGSAADRIALALVTLGLYVAASLLMQHSLGPRVFHDVPVLATFGYGLALWFTLKLVRGIGRTGGP